MIPLDGKCRTVSMPEACEALGISRQQGHRLAAKGEFPVPVLTLGRTTRIPVRPLLALLGEIPDEPPAHRATA